MQFFLKNICSESPDVMKKERRVEDRFKQSRQPFEYNCVTALFQGKLMLKLVEK